MTRAYKIKHQKLKTLERTNYKHFSLYLMKLNDIYNFYYLKLYFGNLNIKNNLTSVYGQL